MKNNLAPIIMIAMYIVMMVKCKKNLFEYI